jgi:CheY-like chemotaxis protein
LRVIALTAHAMEGDEEQCIAAGMDDYLAKPYGQPQLEAVIRRHVSPHPKVAAPAATVAAVVPETQTQTVAEGLDRGVLDSIRALDKSGGNAVLGRLIGIYQQTAPPLVHALRCAAEAGDVAALVRAAHTLRPSSLYVGATRLGSLCREIEVAGKATPPVMSLAQVAELEAEFLRVEQWLREELGPTEATIRQDES